MTQPTPGVPLELFAACPRGVEAALAAELAALGALECRPVGGGVLFSGDRQLAYLANLWSRLASRVMCKVAHRRYRDDDDLYRLAAGVEWERFFNAEHTLRVDISALRSPLRSLNFATLRIKDGIVDRLRERTGERPSIDTRTPDARVFAHLEDRQVVLYLDLSGEPLFKRGWRSGHDDKGAAPLKENLAAGLLAISGWNPSIPLYDPFCGSGTIAIEAAQIAFDIAPGASRNFGFEKLLDHDGELWSRLRDDALQRARKATRRFVEDGGMAQVAASDIDPQAIEQTQRNLLRAGLPEQALKLRVLDVAHARPPFDRPGFLIANPPYGARIHATSDTSGARELRSAPERASAIQAAGSGHDAAMRAFGDALKQHFDGWQAWILTSDPQLPRQLGLKERRRTPLYNGALECRLFGFEIFGPRSAPAPAADDAAPATNGAARSVQATRGRPTRR